MARDRLVPLTDDLPESEGFPLHTCNDCAETRPDTRAVVALEHDGAIHRYYGLCGNHAEVSGVSTEWADVTSSK